MRILWFFQVQKIPENSMFFQEVDILNFTQIDIKLKNQLLIID